MARFDALEQTARANGVPGLARVDAAGITDIEPHAAGLAALHSPETAITDFVAIARTIAGEIEAAGGAGPTVDGGDRHRADRCPGQGHHRHRLRDCRPTRRLRRAPVRPSGRPVGCRGRAADRAVPG